MLQAELLDFLPDYRLPDVLVQQLILGVLHDWPLHFAANLWISRYFDSKPSQGSEQRLRLTDLGRALPRAPFVQLLRQARL